MSAASAGLLATNTRPVGRSTHRKAGMPSLVPCRMPIWLAGVVAGSRGRHSAIWCEPLRTQRERVGRVPPFTPNSRTGNGTPSACTKTTPGTSASGRTVPLRRLALRTRPAVTASSVPAVTTHTAPVETMATIHAATIADRKETPLTPGSQNVSQMMNACPKTASSRAPTQPSRVASATRTGRRRALQIAMESAAMKA